MRKAYIGFTVWKAGKIMFVTRVSVLSLAIILTALALGNAAFEANRPSYAKPLISVAAGNSKY